MRRAISCSSRHARATMRTSEPRSSTGTESGCPTPTPGDVVALRHAHPGAVHLLLWRALQLAVREGRSELDLGGVDVAGARSEPRPGMRCTGCSSSSGRSAAAGWSSPARTSGRCARARARAGATMARLGGSARRLAGPCGREDERRRGPRRPRRRRRSRGLARLAAAEPRGASAALRPAGAPPGGRAPALGDRAGCASPGARTRQRCQPHGRLRHGLRLAPGRAGRLFVAVPGEHVDGHSFAGRAASRAVASWSSAPVVDAGPAIQLVVDRSRLALATWPPGGTAIRGRARGRRHHRDGRQDDHRLAGRGGPGGGRPPDRPRRHGRAEDRRGRRAPRRT